MPVRTASCLTIIGALLPAVAAGQVRSSERATVSQMVDGTVITVDYSRPELRGRVPFPNVVHWGEMWTPGANWASTLELSKPIKLNGREVPAGKYSVWVVPVERAEWTVNLHPNARLFHEAHPNASEMAVSLTVAPTTVAPREVLTFSFPEVRRTGTTLELGWGPIALSLKIEVEPSLPKGHLTREQAAPYLGRFAMISVGAKGDTTRDEFTIDLRDGRLHTEMMGFETVLIEGRTAGVWLLGTVEKGELVDIEENGPVHFEMKDGRAIALVASDEKGSVWFRAERVKKP